MSENIKEDEIMTVSEVATYFKISEVTCYKLVQDGKIPAFKIGRNWRVKKSDIDELMEKLKQGKRI